MIDDLDTTRTPIPSAPLTPQDSSSSGTSDHAGDVTWATPEPVLPTAAPRRRSRLRWVAAIAVVALVVGASSAVAALITGASTDSAVVGYVPADTTMYGEVRLDLPGDQRQAVGSFLQNFPGFADQASLDGKLDEVLDDLIRNATEGAQTYTGDIKPWFGGELAASVGPLPPVSALSGTGSMKSSRALAVVSIKDAALARSWLASALADKGASTATETYQGTTITTFDDVDGFTAGYAIVNGEVVVLGDLVSVKAAIDSNGDSGFASEPGPKAAFASVDSDYVAFGYIAIRPLLDWSSELPDAAISGGAGVATSALNDSMLELLPDWTASWLRFESDALVMEVSAPTPETQIGPTENRTSNVIEHVPSSAVFAVTTNDLGTTLQKTIDRYASDPAIGPKLEEFDQALGLIGGREAAFGWIGDAAFVVDARGDEPDGGIIIAPSDQAAAKQLFTALRTLIALGGGQAGFSVSDETYKGVAITTVDLGDLSSLAGLAGAQGAPVPVPTGKIQISFAVTDEVVVIGFGSGFVKGVIETTPATSLAADPTYNGLAAQAGPGTGTTFIDITALRGMIETAMAAADKAGHSDYEADVKPFLDPFDAFFASSSIEGDLARSEIFITVK
ncbi:MAG: DUF3352 domain-containing protein [Thermomicrobiales bacterium]|nr:MAG: DUF3352 domain-containing protein [Thermomicrobiales bacterium]